jgi:hypothetical protein
LDAAVAADHTTMAEREHPTDEDQPAPRGRVDRHKIVRVPADAPPAPAEREEEAVPASPQAAPRVWRARRTPAPLPPPKDTTRDALRRPALLSDRCLGCGAATKGRAGMVTELVEVGPIRALRVVACSACPDRRRRALSGL